MNKKDLLTYSLNTFIMFSVSTLQEVLMEIRDMRKRTGMTQRAFAEKYHIPLQTLKQWESRPESTSYRKAPDYVVHMLERQIEQDFNIRFGPLSRVENLAVAARHSYGSLRQWLRYLGKEFEGHKVKLTDEHLSAVLESDDLSMIQKVVLKEAMKDGSATNRYVVSLGERAKTPMVDALTKGIV